MQYLLHKTIKLHYILCIFQSYLPSYSLLPQLQHRSGRSLVFRPQVGHSIVAVRIFLTCLIIMITIQISFDKFHNCSYGKKASLHQSHLLPLKARSQAQYQSLTFPITIPPRFIFKVQIVSPILPKLAHSVLINLKEPFLSSHVPLRLPFSIVKLPLGLV